MVLIGVVAGLAGTAALGRVIATQLFGVGSADPWVLGTVTLVLFLIALVACAVPALNAGRTPPMIALR